MAEPVFHRIHPLTILVDLGRWLSRFAIAIAFFVFASLSGGNGDGDMVELVATGVGALVVLPAIFRYLFFQYAIHEGNLLIKDGLIVKKNRTIPLDRIQNINIKRSFLHRVLGLVDLQIETASGAQAEAALSALAEEKGQIVKAQLLGQAPRIHGHVLEERRKDVAYRATVWELALAGATENRALTIIGFVIGGQFAFQGLFSQIIDADKWERWSQNAWLIGGGIFALILVGWLASIVATVVKYYGFELVRDTGRLRRHYGLINQVENVVPVQRVQVIRVRQSLFQKWCKIVKVFVDTAGAFGDKKDGAESIATSSVLTPALAVSALPVTLGLVYPKSNLQDRQFQSVSRLTLPRHLRATVIPAVLVASALSFVVGWWSIAIYFGFLLLGAFSGWIYLKGGRFSDDEQIFAIQKGILGRSTTYVPCDKVQCVGLSQSPLQRSLGLMTVSVSTAAQNLHGEEISVEDLPEEQALALASRLHNRSAHSRDSLLDGL